MSSEIESEYYAHIVREIDRLMAIKAALERGTHPGIVKTPDKRPVRTVAGKERRAARGVVDSAILAVLGAKGLTSPEIRAKLAAGGYEYSLHPMQLSKALKRIVERKQAMRAKLGTRVEYRLVSK